MFQFPRPDFNYDSSLKMEFVPVHQLVKSERFQKYCDDKENILKLINSENGHSQDTQYIHQLLDEDYGNKQRFHDKSETAVDASQPAELFQSDSGQSNHPTHDQADKQQE